MGNKYYNTVEDIVYYISLYYVVQISYNNIKYLLLYQSENLLWLLRNVYNMKLNRLDQSTDAEIITMEVGSLMKLL